VRACEDEDNNVEMKAEVHDRPEERRSDRTIF
jgi:hypothetical protein